MCVFIICSSKGRPSAHHSSLNISRSETKNFNTKNSKENCDFIGGFNFKKRQKSSMDNNNRYGLMRQRSGVWRSLRDGDFEEEDVWDVLRDKNNSNSKIGISIESSISIPRNLSSSPSATSARMIPRATSSSGSCSSNNSSVQQQSAPVNIPDWSKICKKKASKNAANSWHDDDDDDDDDDGYHRDSDDEGDDDIDNYKLPPHELISRRLARSQISSFSVLEGVGRKLKGRDLSKVRNAVLTKTGFLESP